MTICETARNIPVKATKTAFRVYREYLMHRRQCPDCYTWNRLGITIAVPKIDIEVSIESLLKSALWPIFPFANYEQHYQCRQCGLEAPSYQFKKRRGWRVKLRQAYESIR